MPLWLHGIFVWLIASEIFFYALLGVALYNDNEEEFE